MRSPSPLTLHDCSHTFGWETGFERRTAGNCNARHQAFFVQLPPGVVVINSVLHVGPSVGLLADEGVCVSRIIFISAEECARGNKKTNGERERWRRLALVVVHICKVTPGSIHERVR